MRLNIIFLFALVLNVLYSSALFSSSYDSATYAAQQGKWKEAHQQFNALLVDKPDNADVLYDAGVAAYNLENYAQASTCFVRAAECADRDVLRVMAHYNAGNAYAADKNFKMAIGEYDKVLAQDPAHEYARHNRDCVLQMLQQEEQQKNQEQQQQDNQKNDDKKEKQGDDARNDHNGQNDQEQQNGNDQGNDQQEQQSGQDQKNKNNKNRDASENESDQPSEGDQGDSAEHSGKGTQRKEHGNDKEHQKKPADNEKRDGNHDSQQSSRDKNNKSDAKQSDKHKGTPEKQSKRADNSTVTADGGQEQGKDGDGQDGAVDNESQDELNQQRVAKQINDPWLLQVLNNQEERDKAMNRQLMKAKTHQHGGKDVQNCW